MYELGEQAYNAYVQLHGGGLPVWNTLSDKDKASWEETAKKLKPHPQSTETKEATEMSGSNINRKSNVHGE